MGANAMTSQRWQVLHGATGLGHVWIAQPKEEGPGAVFDTWREAMDYADRQARTIEVTLPTSATTHLFSLHTYPVDDGLFIERREIGFWQSIGIEIKRHELEPLALALLAHHYKNQDTP